MIETLPDLATFETGHHTQKPHVAISACLNGEAVRYDATAKTLEATLTLLAKHLQLVSICPEVGAGMGVPRPPIQLVEIDGQLRARGRDDPSIDATAALDEFRRQSLERVGQQLSGYILKSRSPSCGIETTPLFNNAGDVLRLGSGMQAHFFQQQLPWLQMIDECGLERAQHCELFINRCRWLADVRHHAATKLGELYVHYQPIIEAMGIGDRQLIDRAHRERHADRFWQSFGIGLQAICFP